MEKQSYKVENRETQDALQQIARGAFGNPIIFDSEPINSKMKGSTWGKWGLSIYIKFVDGVGLKITGTSF